MSLQTPVAQCRTMSQCKSVKYPTSHVLFLLHVFRSLILHILDRIHQMLNTGVSTQRSLLRGSGTRSQTGSCELRPGEGL